MSHLLAGYRDNLTAMRQICDRLTLVYSLRISGRMLAVWCFDYRPTDGTHGRYRVFFSTEHALVCLEFHPFDESIAPSLRSFTLDEYIGFASMVEGDMRTEFITAAYRCQELLDAAGPSRPDSLARADRGSSGAQSQDQIPGA